MKFKLLKNVYPDGVSVARAAADSIAALAVQRVNAARRFNIALAGGSTPKQTYELLAADPLVRRMPWDSTRIYFGDERHVKHDHPDSNYRMASEALVKPANLQNDRVFPMLTDNDDVNQCAEWYEDLLRVQFQRRTDNFPAFDLILLGIGPDGHTASIFPGTPVVNEKVRWVAPCDPTAVNPQIKPAVKRITLTPPVIQHAANVFVLAVGAEKAPIVSGIFSESEPANPPVSRLLRECKGDVTFFLDKAAAG